jgi:hypothetical protein
MLESEKDKSTPVFFNVTRVILKSSKSKKFDKRQ